MNWKLEVVVIPVSDVDRAKQFYSEQLASTSTSITGWVHPFGTSS
jgi:predicted enzyme related to lactoylglutathione lyase